MAEEKIRILVAKDPCESCKLKPCPRKCIFSILYERAPGMSSQEAIEKMRKGFGTKYRGYFYCEPKHPNISDCLEAALNALLED